MNRISPAVVDQIRSIWVANPSWTGVKVYEYARTRVSGCPKLRKVQELGRDLKRKAQANQVPFQDPPIVPWGPMWPKDVEEIACLFKLMRTTLQDERAVPIHARNAKWALTLRKIFEGEWEGGIHHLFWATSYAWREKMTQVVKGPEAKPFTDDLDGVMMFRMWESVESANAYQEAVEDAKIPLLNVTYSITEEVRLSKMVSGEEDLRAFDDSLVPSFVRFEEALGS